MPRLDDGEQFLLFWGHNLPKSTRAIFAASINRPRFIDTTSPFASSKMRGLRSAANPIVFSVSGPGGETDPRRPDYRRGHVRLFDRVLAGILFQVSERDLLAFATVPVLLSGAGGVSNHDCGAK